MFRAFVELGDRYAALGLTALAKYAFESACAHASSDTTTAHERLVELAIAVGDGESARRVARELASMTRGPALSVLVGQAHLAAGELGAAAFAFAGAVDVARDPLTRIRALHGRARVASAEGDQKGAAANAMAAVDEVIALASHQHAAPDALEVEFGLIGDVIAHAITLGRGEDVERSVGEASIGPWGGVLQAVALSARSAHGEVGVRDSVVDEAWQRALTMWPDSRFVRIRLNARRLRRRYRDRAARDAAVMELERVASELQQAGALTATQRLDLANVNLLVAAAYEDDPSTLREAVEAYRRGLAARPTHAAAALRLANVLLEQGAATDALGELERCLRLDAGNRLAWRAGAQLIDNPPAEYTAEDVVSRLLNAARPGAGLAACGPATQLAHAVHQEARTDVLTGMYAHGHRLKNLIGIVGARIRSVARQVTGDQMATELPQRLASLEQEVTSLYDEWALYLRSMQTTTPVTEVISVAALLSEVATAVRAKCSATIEVDIAGALPDLRGDRVLLREAFINVVSNAVEASDSALEPVTVRARVVAAGGAPAVEVVVTDQGVGISESDLRNIFSPGFTTKQSGSGIGLTVAERVVAAHQGRLVVHSAPDEGTRLTIVLPSDLASVPRWTVLAGRAARTEVG